MKHILKISQISLWLYSKLLVKTILSVNYTKDEQISHYQPKMFISNHVSLFDAAMFIGSMNWAEFRKSSPTRAILAKWYYHSPLFVPAYLVGCYPAKPLFSFLKRYSGIQASLTFLKSGQSVGIYPEGTRVKGQRKPAKRGVSKILQQTETKPAIYLCKIERTGARKFNVIIARDDKVAELTDPDKIMDAVYALS